MVNTVTIIVLNFFNFWLLESARQNSYCLAQPSTLKFTNHDNSKNHIGNLEYVAKSFTVENDGVYVDFTARVFNGQIPGPILRLKRGHRYYINLKNNLGPNNPNEPKIMNTVHSPNTTNLHIHGLHISGVAPGDDTFIEVQPGDTYQYHYHLPCNHIGGTHWYHAHVHGASTINVGGGAAGAIIVEDDKDDGLPLWYTSMRELIIVIQYFDLGLLDGVISDDYDHITKYDIVNYNGPFYLLNGKYQPIICLNSNEWTKLRIINIRVSAPADTRFFIWDENNNDTVCSIKLLARDGILVYGTNSVPRDIPFLWTTLAGRIDVALYCPGNIDNNILFRNYTLRALTSSIPNTIPTIIGIIQVFGNSQIPIIPKTNLDIFNPIRPSYLPNLLNVNNYTNWTIAISNNGIGDNLTIPQSFVNKTYYNKHLFINNIYQINLCSVNGIHPFHMHVNPVQIISQNTAPSYIPNSINSIGDYIDVVTVIARCNDINETRSIVRFIPNTFGGNAILHCHILTHVDRGAMAVALIHGGCDSNIKNNFYIENSLDFDENNIDFYEDNSVDSNEDDTISCRKARPKCPNDKK